MGHIFISYSHKDSGYAHKLAEMLKRGGFEVWIDARLDYGSQWPQEIQKQLDSCSAFILIMSPRAFDSEWVQSELSRAKRKNIPIFPLLLEGDEPWLSVESTQFFDVRGETLPDEKFYRTLWRVVQPANNAQTLRASPPNVEGQNKARKTANFGWIVGGAVAIGLICVCLGGVSYLWLKSNTWAIPSPSQTPAMVVSPTSIGPTEPPRPNLDSTYTPVVNNGAAEARPTATLPPGLVNGPTEVPASATLAPMPSPISASVSLAGWWTGTIKEISGDKRTFNIVRINFDQNGFGDILIYDNNQSGQILEHWKLIEGKIIGDTFRFRDPEGLYYSGKIVNGGLVGMGARDCYACGAVTEINFQR